MFSWLFKRKPPRPTASTIEAMRLVEVTGICQYDDCDRPAEDMAFKAPGRIGFYCDKHKQIIERSQ